MKRKNKNKKLFKEAGIIPPDFDDPWNWYDLQTAVKKLTRDKNDDGVIDSGNWFVRKSSILIYQARLTIVVSSIIERADQYA